MPNIVIENFPFPGRRERQKRADTPVRMVFRGVHMLLVRPIVWFRLLSKDSVGYSPRSVSPLGRSLETLLPALTDATDPTVSTRP